MNEVMGKAQLRIYNMQIFNKINQVGFTYAQYFVFIFIKFCIMSFYQNQLRAAKRVIEYENADETQETDVHMTSDNEDQ